MTRLLSPLLVLVLLGVCSCEQRASTLALTAADGGTTIALRVGDSFDVALAETAASTAYRWEIAASGAPQVELVGDELQRPNTSLVGASATRVFHFRAATPGDATLALVDRRPFGTDPPSATFTVNVSVRP